MLEWSSLVGSAGLSAIRFGGWRKATVKPSYFVSVIKIRALAELVQVPAPSSTRLTIHGAVMATPRLLDRRILASLQGLVIEGGGIRVRTSVAIRILSHAAPG